MSDFFVQDSPWWVDTRGELYWIPFGQEWERPIRTDHI